jgi:adenylate kinase
MRIALFGPPGVGKGTQAALLVEREKLAQISTGEMIRAAMREESDVGQEARQYVESGRLVPGEIVRRLAEDAIAHQDFDQFILDGYPRTIEQAEWLTLFLDRNEAPLTAVVSIIVPDEIIVERLSSRRIHRDTGKVYHLNFNPPPGDVPPEVIVQRSDDRPEAIRKRLREYREQTMPVSDYYRTRGLLREVDGVGEVEEVYERIRAEIDRSVPAS